MTAWVFVLILHPHIYAMSYEIGTLVLPTWETCEATRRAVESLPMLDVGTVRAEGCRLRPENSA